MNKVLLRGATFLLLVTVVFAQAMLSAPRIAYAQVVSVYLPQQLEQLVAPIALYPDPLLGEVLMASTYPQEVSEAAQWRYDNPGLAGDYLTGALSQEPWDPSVKGLTLFPQVLQMMSSNLDWTEKLGEAFLADQQGTMDAVQSLRRQAQASGVLLSSPQQVVSLDNGTVLIEPADPAEVYVPYYNPVSVFSPWPYPNYMPYYFVAPNDVVYNGLFGYVGGIVVIDALWNWDTWDWRAHRIHVDNRRWRNLNNGQPPAVLGVWGYQPEHRHNVPYKDAALRTHFENTPAAARNTYRGYDEDANDNRFVSPERSVEVQPRPPVVSADDRHGVTSGERGQPERRAPEPQHAAPALFESFAPGPQVKTEAARGSSSSRLAPPEARSPQPERSPSPNESPKDERR